MERERFFKTINAGINTAAALLTRDWHRWASMLRRLEDCWFEIWVFKELMSAASLGLPVAGVSQSGEKSEVES
jgi:hypothetical protein